MDDERGQAGSRPTSRRDTSPKQDANEQGNEVRLKVPFDPSIMYFEVDDVVFEGESRESHEAERVYEQALEEEKKVPLAHMIIAGGSIKSPTGTRLTETEQSG